jgi:nucleoside-diphosphate-sugar epimerase
MHTILVTGANGFVGSALCDALNLRQLRFIGSVREKTTSYQHQIGPMTATTDWSGALDGCDVLIHLAARVHVMNEQAGGALASYREVNVHSTVNLARQALAMDVKRFIFVSSIKVNGEETTSHPFTAFDVPAPLDPYGESKLEAEIALRKLSQGTGLEVVIVRPPLVYGPGVRANFLKLMRLVKMGLPLPFGSVHNRRSMVAIDNLIDLLITCVHHPAAAGQTFMVSDDNDVSISELLCMLSAPMGKRPLLFPFPRKLIGGIAALLGKSTMANRLLGSLEVDISHTKSTLGWQPAVTMQEELDKTVAYFLALS